MSESPYSVDVIDSLSSSTSSDVVLLIEDEAPITIGYLPLEGDEGDIEFFFSEILDDVIVFAFHDGSWHEQRESEDDDIDLRFGRVPSSLVELFTETA